MFYDIPERENAFPSYKTMKLNSRKTKIFSNGLPMVFRQKITIFPSFFSLGNIGQENVFYHIEERKNACLGYKNKKLKHL